MRLDLKKNEKQKKIITVILAGLLLLIVAIPSKNKSENVLGNSTDSGDEADILCRTVEERLDRILEDSYGKDTMEVMVNLAVTNTSNNFMGSGDTDYKVDGVLIVAHVNDANAVSDISYAVCALFDLPVHKVAVIVR